MSVFSIILIVLGAVDMIAGLASLIMGKAYMMTDASQYTDESLKKFSRPLGISNLLSGAGLILLELVDSELFNVSGFAVKAGLIILIVLLILALVVYFAGRKVLVKK